MIGRHIFDTTVARLRAFRRDDRGATAIIVGIAFPVLVGGMGMGAEVGYWYFTQRTLQEAADVAAHAGGVRKAAGDTKPKIDSTALYIAQQSGFSPGIIAVNVPPTAGTYAGNPGAVEVLLSRSLPPLFSSVFLSSNVDVGGRAVALVEFNSKACMLALSTTEDRAINISGSTTVNLTNCDVASNSTASDAFYVGGSGQITTDCVYTSGGADTTSGLHLSECSAVSQYQLPTADPYAGVPEPQSPSTCPNGGTINGGTVSPPDTGPDRGKRCFKNGLSIKSTVHFDPGVYIIDGGTFTINNDAVVTGSHVMFYFKNGGDLKINGTSVLNLSAPSPTFEHPILETYSGLLFFGERDSALAANTIKVNGTSGSTFTGAVYFPSSDVEYTGNSTTTGGCTQVIGLTITLTGNSDFQSDCSDDGTSDILTGPQVSLVE
ncbi:TadE/TadG family type IV pilus assembly protein [Inquilinus sp. OTU3971]|uniref:TadE/TadG family type IV pilus assembly protein n=1 Tax=Inquilinus sp. OTU3971 TaxID=3043855 RepID=UPI00313E10E4